jgi:hypothetical protein
MALLAPLFGPIFRRKLLSTGAENALVQGAPGRQHGDGKAHEFMMEEV